MAWIQLNSTELLKSSHRVMTTTSCCFVLASLMFRLLCSIAVMVLSPNRRLPTLLGLRRNPRPLRPIWRPKLPHQIIWSRHQSHDEIPNPRYVNKRIPWPIQEIVLIGHGNVGINTRVGSWCGLSGGELRRGSPLLASVAVQVSGTISVFRNRDCLYVNHGRRWPPIG